MGSDGMRVYDVSLFVGLHASKVKIALKLRFITCEISSKTAIIMTHYPYFPYRGERVRRVMEANQLLPKHKNEWTDDEGVYWVDWKIPNEAGVWRANFLSWDSYLMFVMKGVHNPAPIEIVAQGHREVV